MFIAVAISAIDAHIQTNGGLCTSWYVGVAADPRSRLFVDHRVRENGDAWIFKDCGSDTAARGVEDYFLKKGCRGGPGGGDYRSRYVYAYRIAAHTSEAA